MIEHDSVTFGSHVLDFSVIRRERRTLEIAVEPDARIVVTAPLDTAAEDIRARVRKRAEWIRRQQRYFTQFHPRTPERRYLSGETHLYLGRQYRLKVVLHVQKGVKLHRGRITVHSHRPGDAESTRELVEAWYRDRAHLKYDERVKECLKRFPDASAFRPETVIVRRLNQRWGSMSPGRRLILNTRLIQAPVDAIDYVITHELCHVAEPHHGAAFYDLLEQVMPDWQRRKERLERVMV